MLNKLREIWGIPKKYPKLEVEHATYCCECGKRLADGEHIYELHYQFSGKSLVWCNLHLEVGRSISTKLCIDYNKTLDRYNHAMDKDEWLERFLKDDE
jgi:hypothetical protein